MCGLFAVVPTRELTKEEAAIYSNAFYMLGMMNESRGKQSWGVWAKPLSLDTGVPASWNLGNIRSDDNKPILRNFIARNTVNLTRGGWIAGHTRHASHGAVSLENCHPFHGFNNVGEHVFVAHNGVMRTQCTSKHEVDTGQFFETILDYRGYGLEGMKDAISRSSGSMGFLISIDSQLYVYSHSQQLAYMKVPGAYLISSVDHVLDFIADLLYINYTVLKEFKSDTLYFFNEQSSLGWQTRPMDTAPPPPKPIYNIRRYDPLSRTFPPQVPNNVGWTAADLDYINNKSLLDAVTPRLFEPEDAPPAPTKTNMVCDFCMKEATNLVVREDYQICRDCQMELSI